jgi:bla regulator protein blaR1
MLKALLIDRFKLAAHMETKEHSVYALTVGKTGLKIREAADDETPPTSKTLTGRLELHKVTMQRVADLLSGITMKLSERPVVDMTGLKGLYDVTLDGRRRIRERTTLRP